MTVLPKLELKKTAVIVVDKQDGYFSRLTVGKRKRSLPDNAELVLNNIDSFIERCRDIDLKIYWTQMVEDIDESPDNITEIMKSDDDRVEVKEDSAGFQIVGRTKPLPRDKVIIKHYYDAFAKTDLDDQLKNDSIETVVLVGGYASRCVLGTAYGANGHDYRVIVIRDLVVNQISDVNEMPSFYKVIEAILGYTTTENELFDQLHA